MKPRRILQRVALVLIAVALPCFAAELWLRGAHAHRAAELRARHVGRDLCTRAAGDPALVYTYVAGRCGANSEGFPDAERSFEKPKGSLRLVLIGDSVAAGDGLRREQRFANLLERSLDDTSPVSVEVLVLARTGYSTAQELLLLRDEAARYDPDLILWSYVLNDPAHPLFHNANGELGEYYHRPRLHLLQKLRRWGFSWANHQRKQECPEEFHAMLHCVFWEEIEGDLAEIASFSRQTGIPVLFVIHPIFEDGRDFSDYTLADVHGRLADAASSLGLGVLDLLPTFRAHDPRELRVQNGEWFDPWHPNAAGHRVIADALYDTVRENAAFAARHGGARSVDR